MRQNVSMTAHITGLVSLLFYGFSEHLLFLVVGGLMVIIGFVAWEAEE